MCGPGPGASASHEHNTFGHEHNAWVDESAFEQRTLIGAYWTTQTERCDPRCLAGLCPLVRPAFSH